MPFFSGLPFEGRKFPTRLRPNMSITKIYANEYVSFDGHRWNLIDETSWTYDPHINEWLTEHCNGLWGFFVENYTLSQSKDSIEFLKSICKPYIGFQNKDDALLFKLSV